MGSPHLINCFGSDTSALIATSYHPLHYTPHPLQHLPCPLYHLPHHPPPPSATPPPPAHHLYYRLPHHLYSHVLPDAKCQIDRGLSKDKERETADICLQKDIFYLNYLDNRSHIIHSFGLLLFSVGPTVQSLYVELEARWLNFSEVSRLASRLDLSEKWKPAVLGIFGIQFSQKY